MPEVQEVFHMATQKVRPDSDALERQHRYQGRRIVKQKGAVYALVAALVVAGLVLAISTLRSGDDTAIIPGDTPTPAATLIPPLSSGALEPGRYVFSSLDPGLDASHQITIDVPDGYEGDAGFLATKLRSAGEVSVSVWAVGNVYGDPCDWAGTLGDPAAASSVDGVAAALAGHRRLQVSTPTAVTVDGFPATYMERTVPAGITLADCHQGQFRTWLATDGGARYVQPGQHDLLWIVDVDDVPVVIDATLAAGTSAENRAELLQIVESVRIDPR